MLINRSDPLSRVLSINIDGDSTFNTLISWKFHLIRKNTNIVFIKFADSKYILAIDILDIETFVYGIWDLTDTIGIVTSSLIVNNLKSLVFVSIPPVQLNAFNTSVFDKVHTKSQRIDTKAFEILCRLVSSSTHSNKSHKELAIKALQLSMEYETQLADVVTLLQDNIPP